MILTDSDGRENFYSLTYLRLYDVSYIERDSSTDTTTITYADGEDSEFTIDDDSHDLLSQAAQKIEDEQQAKAAIPCQNVNLPVSNASTQSRPLRVQTE